MKVLFDFLHTFDIIRCDPQNLLLTKLVDRHPSVAAQNTASFLYPEDMERVRGVTTGEAGWIAKLIYRELKKRMGLVPKSKTLTAHHTQTLVASTWMDAVNASARTVPIVLKELAQLKVAMMAGCPF